VVHVPLRRLVMFLRCKSLTAMRALKSPKIETLSSPVN
jgi:hypothetical protein